MEKKILAMMSKIEAMQKAAIEMNEEIQFSPNSDLSNAAESLREASFEMRQVWNKLESAADSLKAKREKLKPWTKGKK